MEASEQETSVNGQSLKGGSTVAVTWLECLTVLVACSALTLWMTDPLVRHWATHVLTAGDGHLNAYLQAWVTHALTTPGGRSHLRTLLRTLSGKKSGKISN